MGAPVPAGDAVPCPVELGVGVGPGVEPTELEGADVAADEADGGMVKDEEGLAGTEPDDDCETPGVTGADAEADVDGADVGVCELVGAAVSDDVAD